MDAATLRLILVVVGAVFLIGLYLWERQRADAAEGGAGRPVRRAKSAPKRRSRSTVAERQRHEPELGGLDDNLQSGAGDGFGGDFDDDLDEDAYADSYAPALGSGTAVDDAPRTSGAAAAPESAQSPSGQLLIQLYITSHGDAFSGEEILSAAERFKLRPGDMDIFHRTRGDAADGEPLFSMANLVKPGTFPFDDMTEFASPGLAVFAQFRGEPSDLMVFDEMLDAARVIAELLGGDIRGPKREPLRDADARELRAQVRALLHGSDEGDDAR